MSVFRLKTSVAATFVFLAFAFATTVVEAKEQTAGVTRLKVGDQAPRFGVSTCWRVAIGATSAVTAPSKP